MSAVSAPLAKHWRLDPSITFLNHGSFGACPTVVLAAQRELVNSMEAEPVRFLSRELEARLDTARQLLAEFLGAQPADLVFVPNATAGVNAVLRSLHFQPRNELLTTNHGYNACKNALHYAAEHNGARVMISTVPYPIQSAEEIVAAILGAVTPRTKLVLLDHVTSPTALIFPVAKIVSELQSRGIDTLVDGAHAPGMFALNLKKIGATYYAGNCHKWVCAPKGAGFLHVRRDKQSAIRPLSISHGANSSRVDRSRFQIEFNWTGTVDFTPYLCIPVALRTLAAMVPGSWSEIFQRNHALAVEARKFLCDALNVPPPCPADLLGSMATVPLPGTAVGPPTPLNSDPLQDALLFSHKIEVPLMGWSHPKRLVRISAQLYNQSADYEHLAAALKSSGVHRNDLEKIA